MYEEDGTEELDANELPTAGTRLTIEVKNRARVSTADVQAFEAKVREGVDAGILEGGIFVSLQCPIPGQTTAVRQTLLEDRHGHATVPMAYICTERGANQQPVTADQLKILAQAHFEMCTQAAKLRTWMNRGDLDEFDLKRVQAHFGELSTYTHELFEDFRRHAQLLDNARKSLDTMKQRALLFFRTAKRLNASVPWLQRPMPSFAFEKGLEHAMRLSSEGRLSNWSSITAKDALMRDVGRECAEKIMTEELACVKKELELAERHRGEKRGREE